MTTRPSPGVGGWLPGAGSWVLGACSWVTADRLAASSFVEPIVSKYTSVDATRPRRGRARSIAVTRSAGASTSSRRPAGLTGSRGFDFKADVDGRRRVRQRADRHEVGAGGGQLGNALERHAARDLDLRASAGSSHRVADAIGRHVVDEDR